MRSLQASLLGLKKIKEAREKRALAIDKEEWLEKASNFIPPTQNGKKVVPVKVSIGTWKRFLQGTSVKPMYFKAFCQVLELNWEEVVDTSNEGASDDHTIRLWDTQTGCFKVLTGHQDRIWSVCYSPQLDVLFSCGEDETIKLWDIHALQCIKTLRIPKPYEGMNINGVSGLNSATLQSLRVLGAVSPVGA